MTEGQIPYLNEIPVEHVKRAPDGEILLTELGVIHLCTLVEQRHPEKAALAADFRRAMSAHCQKLRGQSNG